MDSEDEILAETASPDNMENILRPHNRLRNVHDLRTLLVG